MLTQLTDFKISVEENGISRKDIQMFETEIGENLITSRININHFTETRTTVGLEAFRSLFNDILNRKQGDTNMLEVYKENQAGLNALRYVFERLEDSFKRIKEIKGKCADYLKNDNNAMVFNNNDQTLIYLIDLPVQECMLHPMFTKYIANLAGVISDTKLKNQLIAEVTEIQRTLQTEEGLSSLPIVDFILSPAISNYNRGVECFIETITKAYEQALLDSKIYSIRELLFLTNKAPQIVENACKMKETASILRPTEYYITPQELSRLSNITNDWVNSKTYAYFSILEILSSCN